MSSELKSVMKESIHLISISRGISILGDERADEKIGLMSSLSDYKTMVQSNINFYKENYIYKLSTFIAVNIYNNQFLLML